MKNKLNQLKKKIEEISPFVVLVTSAVLAIGTVAVLQQVQNAAQNERRADDYERELLEGLESGDISQEFYDSHRNEF